MRVPGTLLATGLALLTDVAPATGELSRQLGRDHAEGTTTYFFETLATGDSTALAEHGPITLTAVCNDHGIQLDVSIEATVDDFFVVVGNGWDVGPLPAGETYTNPRVFFVPSAGNDIDQGGVMTGSGYYLGWDGESTLAVQRPDATNLEAFGDNINCVVAGSLKLIDKH